MHSQTLTSLLDIFKSQHDGQLGQRELDDRVAVWAIGAGNGVDGPFAHLVEVAQEDTTLEQCRLTDEFEETVVVVVVYGGEYLKCELNLGALANVAVQVLDGSQSVAIVQVHEYIIGAELGLIRARNVLESGME